MLPFSDAGYRINTDGFDRKTDSTALKEAQIYIDSLVQAQNLPGFSIGGRAFILMVPEKGIVIALLSNVSLTGFGEKEALEIAGIFE